jgi:hypothetical protein
MVLEVRIDDKICDFRERPYNFVADWTMVDALNRTDDAFLNATKLHFKWVRFEGDDSVGALQACLDRATGRGHMYEEIAFDYCAGEGVENAVCTVIQSNCCSRLCLAGETPATFSASVANALCINTSLQFLSIRVDRFETADVEHLFDALCVNRTLGCLTLSESTIGGNESMIAIGSRLPEMRGLRRLHLPYNFGRDGKQALLKGLQRNTQLLSFQVELAPADLQEHIDFVLALNLRGGQAYLENLTRDQWIDLLTEYREDVNALNYILSDAPQHTLGD